MAILKNKYLWLSSLNLSLEIFQNFANINYYNAYKFKI